MFSTTCAFLSLHVELYFINLSMAFLPFSIVDACEDSKANILENKDLYKQNYPLPKMQSPIEVSSSFENKNWLDYNVTMS